MTFGPKGKAKKKPRPKRPAENKLRSALVKNALVFLDKTKAPADEPGTAEDWGTLNVPLTDLVAETYGFEERCAQCDLTEVRAVVTEEKIEQLTETVRLVNAENSALKQERFEMAQRMIGAATGARPGDTNRNPGFLLEAIDRANVTYEQDNSTRRSGYSGQSVVSRGQAMVRLEIELTMEQYQMCKESGRYRGPPPQAPMKPKPAAASGYDMSVNDLRKRAKDSW